MGNTRFGAVRLGAWFLGLACLHFVLSVTGMVLALRAGFAVQGGQLWAGWLREPVAVTLAYLAEALLAPLALVRLLLPATWRDGYAEIMIVSVLFAAVGTAILHVARSRRERSVAAGRARADT